MSYSEMLGSFVRTGNYPLEANMVFETEREMKDFYAIPANAATMYEGMIRIVNKGEIPEIDADGNIVGTAIGQQMWWCVRNKTTNLLELKEFKMTYEVTRDNLDDAVKSLQQYIDNLDTSINNLIQVRVQGLEDEDTRQAAMIATCQAKETDIYDILKAWFGEPFADYAEFLSKLNSQKYKSFEELSNYLWNFCNTASDLNLPISNFKDVKNFLSGFVSGQNLYDIINNMIIGSGTPQTGYTNLNEIAQQIIRVETSLTQSLADELVEINNIENGVGLDGNGSYQADPNTNYIQSARSVANALHILDAQMKVAIDKINGISTNNIDSCVELQVTADADKNYTITPKFNTSNQVDNALQKLNDGLFTNSELLYSDGVITYKVNGNIKSQYDLNISAILKDASYDPVREELMFTFSTHDGNDQIVHIPVSSMIRSWEVRNDYPTKVVELTKEVSIGNGNDKLSADVRISTYSSNILEKDGQTLLVRGEAGNIKLTNGTTVQDKLDNIDASITAANTAITTNASNIHTNSDSITELQRNTNQLRTNTDTNTASIDTINDTINTLNTAITDRFNVDENRLNTVSDALDSYKEQTSDNIKDLQDRRDANDVDITRLQTALSTLTTQHSDDINAAQTDRQAIRTALETTNNTLSTYQQTNDQRSQTIEETATDLADKVDVNNDLIATETINRTNADANIQQQISTLNSRLTVIGGVTDTARVNAVQAPNGTTVTTAVRVSNHANNVIQALTDGLFTSFDMSYDEPTNSIIYTINGTSTSVKMEVGSIIQRGYYDAVHEQLVFVMQNEDHETYNIEVPIHDLILEMQVDNDPSSPIILHREEVVGGNDKLSATINVNTDPDTSTLRLQNGILSANNDSSQLRYDDTYTVQTIIQSILASIATNAHDIADLNAQAFTTIPTQISQLQNKDNELETAVQANENHLQTIQTDVTTRLNDFNNALAQNAANDTVVSSDLQTYKQTNDAAIQTLTSTIDSEVTRSTTRDEALQNSVEHIQQNLQTLTDKQAVTDNALSQYNSDFVTSIQDVRTTYDTALSTVNNRLNNVETDISALQPIATQNSSDIATLTVDLATHITSSDNRFSTIENNLANTATQSDSNKDSIDTINTSLTALQNDVVTNKNQHDTDINTLTTKVDGFIDTTFPNVVTDLNDDVTDINTRLTTAETTLSDTVTNLANEVDVRRTADTTLQNNINAVNAKATIVGSETNSAITSISANSLNNTVITTNVKLAADTVDKQNIIQEFSDGLFTSLSFSYAPATNILTYTINGVDQQIQLNSGSLIKLAYYDSTNKEIVIEFDDVQDPNDPNSVVQVAPIRVPVAAMINEWAVNNNPNSPVVLTYNSNPNGDDTLTANLNVDQSDNSLLRVTNGQLTASNNSTNIKYGVDSNVAEKLDSLIETQSHFQHLADLYTNLVNQIQVLNAFMANNDDLRARVVELERITGLMLQDSTPSAVEEESLMLDEEVE